MATKTKNKESAELAKVEPDTLSLGVELDDLDALLDEAGIDDEDGLVGDLDPRDLKIPILVWNLTSIDDATGKQRPKDAFFNVVTEEMTEEIEAVLLVAYKSNVYKEKEQDADGRRKLVCFSTDQETGRVIATGLERPCDGCPDAQWRKGEGPNGKDAPPHCKEVWNTVWLNKRTQDVFLMRMRGAAYPVFNQHLQRFHFGKRKMKDKSTGKITRCNMPLFVFVVRLSLKLVTNTKGTFAVPVFGDGSPELPRLDGRSIMAAREAAIYYKETILPAERERIALVETHDNDERSNDDASDDDDASAFSDGDMTTGADVVPAETVDF